MSKNNKQEQTEKLFAALKRQDIKEVAAAINAGADIRAKNPDGKSLVQVLNTEFTESMAIGIADNLSPESKKACEAAIKEEMDAQKKEEDARVNSAPEPVTPP